MLDAASDGLHHFSYFALSFILLFGLDRPSFRPGPANQTSAASGVPGGGVGGGAVALRGESP